MPQLALDLRFRGAVHQLTDPDLERRIDADTLTLYSGFDPTADSLHVGHLLQLCTLRRFQLAGHRPIALAGGGTGFIGDPGGKTEERVLLSADELAANVAAVRTQLGAFLDFSPGASAAVLLDNAAWLTELRLIPFLRDVGKHFTVNQMVAKESVRARLERPERGISFTEFSYMLLQAYDFLRLFDDHGCRLQIGGSDQWGNITLGIELIRRLRGAEAFGLTTPLLVKADGGKFGKTEHGTVWLSRERTSPYQLFQFFVRGDDATVGTHLRLLTFLDHDTIRHLDEETAEHPERRAGQRALARAVCTMVHGETETERAERAADALFGEEVAQLDEVTLLDVFGDAPSTSMARSRLGSGHGGGGLLVVDALAETGLVPSKSRARATVEQGGAYVNNRRVDGVDAVLSEGDLIAGSYLVLRRGRKDHHLVRFA
ncbi:MAG: tyrosine--tRNA ligase [Actinomycetota bacterium]|jgi:tyrosyl-tRNA synthetase|nr:tyrosine--tRNA ligase [Actinomycetota bacterium]